MVAQKINNYPTSPATSTMKNVRLGFLGWFCPFQYKSMILPKTIPTQKPNLTLQNDNRNWNTVLPTVTSPLIGFSSILTT